MEIYLAKHSILRNGLSVAEFWSKDCNILKFNLGSHRRPVFKGGFRVKPTPEKNFSQIRLDVFKALDPYVSTTASTV
jgi:hypothetical protein